MGDYIQESELNISTQLAEYLSRTLTAGETNKVVIGREIDKAEGYIKSYISSRYELPLDDASETGIIKALAESITIYRLYLKTDGLQIPEKWVKEYDDAIQMLKDIAQGNVSLGLDTDDEPEAKKASAMGSYVRG